VENANCQVIVVKKPYGPPIAHDTTKAEVENQEREEQLRRMLEDFDMTEEEKTERKERAEKLKKTLLGEHQFGDDDLKLEAELHMFE